MEQKDPHFNIHDYVDLSGITNPQYREIMEDNFQAMARDADLASQTLFREAFELQGKRIEITANDFARSTHLNGVINIDFKQLEVAYYETSPELEHVNYDNYQKFNANYTAQHQRFTLPEVIWHEFEHARDIMPAYEKEAYQAELRVIKDNFDDSVAASALPQNTKDLISSLSPQQASNLLRTSRADFERVTGVALQDAENMAPEIPTFRAKYIWLNSEYQEKHEINATNEHFRIPKDLEPRHLHMNLQSAGTPVAKPVETMTDVNLASIPEVKLMVNGECINCESVDLKDIETPSGTPNNKPTITAELD